MRSQQPSQLQKVTAGGRAYIQMAAPSGIAADLENAVGDAPGAADSADASAIASDIGIKKEEEGGARIERSVLYKKVADDIADDGSQCIALLFKIKDGAIDLRTDPYQQLLRTQQELGRPLGKALCAALKVKDGSSIADLATGRADALCFTADVLGFTRVVFSERDLGTAEVAMLLRGMREIFHVVRIGLNDDVHTMWKVPLTYTKPGEDKGKRMAAPIQLLPDEMAKVDPKFKMVICNDLPGGVQQRCDRWCDRRYGCRVSSGCREEANGHVHGPR